MRNDVWIRINVAGSDQSLCLPLTSSASFVLYRCLSYFGIRECRYFALFHCENPEDSNCEETIFEGNGKLKALKRVTNGSECIHLRLGVMCYPFCVTRVTDLNAVQLIYYSVYQDFLANKFDGASSDDSMYLAALSLQIMYQDYDEGSHETYISAMKRKLVVPLAFYYQHVITRGVEVFLNILSEYYRRFSGWPKLKCFLKYIKRAQSLSQYGVHYFEGVNKTNESVQLGIEGYGLNVFRECNKTCARTTVSWSDVMELQVNKSKFFIKTYRKDNIFLADRTITFARHKLAKKVLQYCMLHHHFYLLFCHTSENTRRSVRLVRRLEQLGIASSPARKELGLESLRTIMSSDDSFYANDLASERLQKIVDIDNTVSSGGGKSRKESPELEEDDVNLLGTFEGSSVNGMNDRSVGNLAAADLQEPNEPCRMLPMNLPSSPSRPALCMNQLGSGQRSSRSVLREISNFPILQTSMLSRGDSVSDGHSKRRVLFPSPSRPLSSDLIEEENRMCESLALLEVSPNADDQKSSSDVSSLHLLSQIETRESYCEGLVQCSGQEETTYTITRRLKRAASARSDFSFATELNKSQCNGEQNFLVEITPSTSGGKTKGKHNRTLSSFSGCSNRPKEGAVSHSTGSQVDETMYIKRSIKSGNTMSYVNMFEKLSEGTGEALLKSASPSAKCK